jgi:hypothetical protein
MSHSISEQRIEGRTSTIVFQSNRQDKRTGRTERENRGVSEEQIGKKRKKR